MSDKASCEEQREEQPELEEAAGAEVRRASTAVAASRLGGPTSFTELHLRPPPPRLFYLTPDPRVIQRCSTFTLLLGTLLGTSLLALAR